MNWKRNIRPTSVTWKEIARKIYPLCRRFKYSFLITVFFVCCTFFIIKFIISASKTSTESERVTKQTGYRELRNILNFGDGADTVHLPSKEKMANMSYKELSTLYHRYVSSLQFECRNIRRLGKLQDGGWDVCEDPELRPKLNNCLVYSFGIDYDFSFDDAVVSRYGCNVHSFDPSMEEGNYKRNQKMAFHSVGLSDISEILRGKGWKMKTFKDIRKELGHTEVPLDILKIDVEEWEWFAIPEMIASGSINDVRQLNVEFHLSIRILPNYQRYLKCLYTLKDLYDLGFRIFWTHRNLWCNFYWEDTERTGCHELSMVRLK